MNRQERRRQNAKARHNKFYENYIRQLPQVPTDAPLETGRVYHTVFQHDDWCAIYDKPNGGVLDCNCNPIITRHLEPKRS